MIEITTNLKQTFCVDKQDFAQFWQDEYVQAIKSLPTKLKDEQIKNIAKKYRQKYDAMLIVGLGANTIPTKAFYECLYHDKKLIFVDNILDESYLTPLLEKLQKMNVCINIISRSCKTREILAIFDRLAKTKKDDIVLTICKNANISSNILQTYPTLIVEDDLSGRFSNFTEYMMFPLAFAGVDISVLKQSAKTAYDRYSNYDSLDNNSPLIYATIQHFLSHQKQIEILSSFNHQITKLFDFYVQLFIESLSKNNSGTFYTYSSYPYDLHFKEQYYIQGNKNYYEVFWELDDKDKQSALFNATKLAVFNAHSDIGTPIIKLKTSEICEQNLGEIIVFFQVACMYLAHLKKINFFDQPGVEMYKANIKKYLE